jgi:hypothetical protein
VQAISDQLPEHLNTAEALELMQLANLPGVSSADDVERRRDRPVPGEVR